MTVAPGPIVEHFNVIEDIRPGQIPVWYVFFLMRSFFSELKNNSATALSWQLPRRLKVIGPQKRCQSSLPYWLPLHNHRRNMLKIILADRIWKVAVSRLH